MFVYSLSANQNYYAQRINNRRVFIMQQTICMAQDCFICFYNYTDNYYELDFHCGFFIERKAALNTEESFQCFIYMIDEIDD